MEKQVREPVDCPVIISFSPPVHFLTDVMKLVGCGKTTQVAQFILDDWILQGKGSVCHIICTQPRRISAISVAERVAQERAEKCGHSVGYQIRLDE